MSNEGGNGGYFDGHNKFVVIETPPLPSSAELGAGKVIPYTTPSVGVKHDTDKTPLELLAPEALLGTAQVLKFGAKKYAANNWRLGLAWMRITGAILRHLFAFMLGEDLDPETGLPHVDHLGCEIMFLQVMFRQRKDLDDRYVPKVVTEKKE